METRIWWQHRRHSEQESGGNIDEINNEMSIDNQIRNNEMSQCNIDGIVNSTWFRQQPGT